MVRLPFHGSQHTAMFKIFLPLKQFAIQSRPPSPPTRPLLPKSNLYMQIPLSPSPPHPPPNPHPPFFSDFSTSLDNIKFTHFLFKFFFFLKIFYLATSNLSSLKCATHVLNILFFYLSQRSTHKPSFRNNISIFRFFLFLYFNLMKILFFIIIAKIWIGKKFFIVIF